MTFYVFTCGETSNKAVANEDTVSCFGHFVAHVFVVVVVVVVLFWFFFFLRGGEGVSKRAKNKRYVLFLCCANLETY